MYTIKHKTEEIKCSCGGEVKEKTATQIDCETYGHYATILQCENCLTEWVFVPELTPAYDEWGRFVGLERMQNGQ